MPRNATVAILFAAISAFTIGLPAAAAPAKAPAKPAAAQAPPAPPKKFFWMSCGYDLKENRGFRLTPVFRVEDPGTYWKTWDWVKREEAQTDAIRSSFYTCYGSPEREEAERIRQKSVDYYSSHEGWSAIPAPPEALAAGSSATAPSGRPSTVGYIEIKPDTSAKDAAKAWDDQVKKALADQAQKKVETAAKAAQQDAETKRKIAEFMAERRRQGNKQ